MFETDVFSNKLYSELVVHFQN